MTNKLERLVRNVEAMHDREAANATEVARLTNENRALRGELLQCQEKYQQAIRDMKEKGDRLEKLVKAVIDDRGRLAVELSKSRVRVQTSDVCIGTHNFPCSDVCKGLRGGFATPTSITSSSALIALSCFVASRNVERLSIVPTPCCVGSATVRLVGNEWWRDVVVSETAAVNHYCLAWDSDGVVVPWCSTLCAALCLHYLEDFSARLSEPKMVSVIIGGPCGLVLRIPADKRISEANVLSLESSSALLLKSNGGFAILQSTSFLGQQLVVYVVAAVLVPGDDFKLAGTWHSLAEVAAEYELVGYFDSCPIGSSELRIPVQQRMQGELEGLTKLAVDCHFVHCCPTMIIAQVRAECLSLNLTSLTSSSVVQVNGRCVDIPFGIVNLGERSFSNQSTLCERMDLAKDSDALDQHTEFFTNSHRMLSHCWSVIAAGASHTIQTCDAWTDSLQLMHRTASLSHSVESLLEGHYALLRDLWESHLHVESQFLPLYAKWFCESSFLLEENLLHKGFLSVECRRPVGCDEVAVFCDSVCQWNSGTQQVLTEGIFKFLEYVADCWQAQHVAILKPLVTFRIFASPMVDRFSQTDVAQRIAHVCVDRARHIAQLASLRNGLDCMSDSYAKAMRVVSSQEGLVLEVETLRRLEGTSDTLRSENLRLLEQLDALQKENDANRKKIFDISLRRYRQGQD